MRNKSKYDATWNLNWLTNNGSASKFVVDNKNELTNAPASNPIWYDANGNMTNYSSGHLNVYTYDDENRLVDFLDQLVGYETVFVYDGLGKLRIRQEYVTGGGQRPFGADTLSGGTLVSETHYIYDGKRVIQEREGNNKPAAAFMAHVWSRMERPVRRRISLVRIGIRKAASEIEIL